MVSTILVNSYNFPPAAPTTIPPSSGWSLIEAWNEGDLTFIEGASGFNGVGCGDSLAWSLDGINITLSSTANTQDIIRTFSCATPFDPSTADTLVSSQSIANPGHAKYNADGSKCYALVVVGDEIQQYGASNYAVNNQAGSVTNITKANVGFTGSSDGGFTIDATGEILVWKGSGGGERWKSFTIPSGNLDNWVLLANGAAPISTTAQGLSPITIDGTTWLKAAGSQGFFFETVDSLQTMANGAVSVSQSVNALVPAFDFRPDHIWFNPLDTSTVWMTDETAGGVKLANFATNV